MGNTYYCCLDLDAQHEQFLRESMDELSRLMAQPPLDVPYCFQELQAQETKAVTDNLRRCSTWNDVLSSTAPYTFCKDRAKLLILCEPSSKTAELAQGKCPDCKWGICEMPFGLALVYPPDGDVYAKYIIWHEVLHLLEANDCYALPDEGPTCGLLNCIMQYKHPKQGYGQGLPLCQANIERVKKHIAEMRRDHSSDAPHRLQ